MIDLYLSVSTQEHNSCKMGDMEENHMNGICDLMVPYIIASGITWKRNNPTMNHITSMQDSNAIGVKMHYAMHSNASNGKARGDHVFYKPFSTEGKFAATLLMEAEKAIYPLPELCKVKLPLILYTEIYSIKAPITAIDEMFFHDNPDDAVWGHANMAMIAKCKAQALCKILGKVFVDPATPAPVPIVSRDPVIQRAQVYTVKSGDTLDAIATFFNTTIVKLVLLNKIKNPDMISVGQIIKISGDSVIPPVVKPPIPSRAHVAPVFNGVVLRLGSKGAEVKVVQQRLDALGFDCGKADSDFGKLTRTAVIKFQKSRKIKADGLVGKITWSKLFS